MIPEDELKLSFYRPLSDIDDRKTMTLVQHVETRELFVRKTLDIYDRDVYEYLREENYAHIPAIKEIIEDDEKLIIIEEYIQGKRLDEVMEYMTPFLSQYAKVFAERETARAEINRKEKDS